MVKMLGDAIMLHVASFMSADVHLRKEQVNRDDVQHMCSSWY